LNVEEQQIRARFTDPLYGFLAARRLTNDFDIGVVGKETENFATRGSFVIDDEDA
jgi:hypothetical protein